MEIQSKIDDQETTIKVLTERTNSLQRELENEKILRENTENAFNKSVDKLIERIRNLERELDFEREGEEHNQKNLWLILREMDKKDKKKKSRISRVELETTELKKILEKLIS